jgi:phosphatidylglycerophosphate synthase
VATERAEPGGGRESLAILADGLTFVRTAIAVLLVPVLARDDFGLAGGLLGLGWLTDSFDGRAARASGVRTRLGPWDLHVDTLVGVGVLAGLTVGGEMPWLVTVALVVLLGGGFVVFQKEALAEVLQAVGYAVVLWRLLVSRDAAFWWPAAVIAFVAVINRRRFIHEILPEFFGGLDRALGLRRR